MTLGNFAPRIELSALNDHIAAVMRWLADAVSAVGPIVATLLSIQLMHSTADGTGDLWNLRNWPWYMNDPSRVATNEYFLRGILFSAVLLILLNVAVYWIYSIDRANWTVVILAVPMVLVAAFWLYHIIEQPFNPLIDDGAALFLFGLFLVSDAVMWVQKGDEIRRLPEAPADPAASCDRHVAAAQQQTYLLQMAMVDLPVLFGIAYALYVWSNVSAHSVVNAVVDVNTAKAFDVGFRIGTLIMHLAISQFIFLVVYWWFVFVRYREKQRKTRLLEAQRTATGIA